MNEKHQHRLPADPDARVPRGGGRAALAVETAAMALLALLTRLSGIGHNPYVDELNHVLAARSFLEDGVFRIGVGAVYDRASLFTRIVAETFRFFGESLVVARIPAVLAGAALVVLLFLWVRSLAGRLAAWTAGVLFILSPGAIYVSQLCRFYTLHALLFLGGVYFTARLFSRPATRTRLIVTGLLACVLFFLAYGLQVLTLIGVGAVALWAALLVLPFAHRRLRSGRVRALAVAGLLAVAALVLLLLRSRGEAASFLGLFRYADLWAAEDRGNFRYYHWLFLEQYATIWTLFPVLALLALRKRPRECGLFVAVFAVGFVVQSVAAWKSERYLFYAMPFFFALAGIGLAEVVSWLLAVGEGALGRVAFLGRRPGCAKRASVVLLVFAGLFAGAGNGAFSIAARQIAGSDANWPFARIYRGEPNWGGAAERIRPLLAPDAVVAASSDLKGFYYFGRIDYLLSWDLLLDATGPKEELAPHWKTGAAVVSEVASVDWMMSKHRSGVVVIEKKQLGKAWGVPAPALERIERSAEEIPLPAEWKLRAFLWPPRAAAATPVPSPEEGR